MFFPLRPVHALHEKCSQRQRGSGPLGIIYERTASFPRGKTAFQMLVNRSVYPGFFQCFCFFNVYRGFRLFVRLMSSTGQVFSTVCCILCEDICRLPVLPGSTPRHVANRRLRSSLGSHSRTCLQCKRCTKTIRVRKIVQQQRKDNVCGPVVIPWINHRSSKSFVP